MSILDQIAFYQNRRDEVPNQDLARRLAASADRQGIAEIAAHCADPEPSVAGDCIKVLYEVGYLQPGLIQEYTPLLIDLLRSKNNRMVWGAMIALSTVASLVPDGIGDRLEEVLAALRAGSAITTAAGVRVLVQLAKADDIYWWRLAPTLLELLEECRPNDFVTRAETIAPVMTEAEQRRQFAAIIEQRLPDLKESGQKKLKRLLR